MDKNDQARAKPETHPDLPECKHNAHGWEPETQGEREELAERLREYVAHKCRGKEVDADLLKAADFLASDDQAEDDALRERMADLLTRTANALRGDPGVGHRWSWHDLPERAQAAIVAIDVMQRAAALLSEGPARVEPLTEEQRKFLLFLDGQGEFMGVWFGEDNQSKRGRFWWRQEMKRLFPANGITKDQTS